VPAVQRLLARAQRVPQQSGRFSMVEKQAPSRIKRGGLA
jgi:hypothetical protein